MSRDLRKRRYESQERMPGRGNSKFQEPETEQQGGQRGCNSAGRECEEVAGVAGQDFADWDKGFRFYSECDRKPLGNFEQGSGVICLTFPKNHLGDCVENRLGRGMEKAEAGRPGRRLSTVVLTLIFTVFKSNIKYRSSKR